MTSRAQKEGVTAGYLWRKAEETGQPVFLSLNFNYLNDKVKKEVEEILKNSE